MLREVCQAYTDLAPEEIRRLELLADQPAPHRGADGGGCVHRLPLRRQGRGGGPRPPRRPPQRLHRQRGGAVRPAGGRAGGVPGAENRPRRLRLEGGDPGGAGRPAERRPRPGGGRAGHRRFDPGAGHQRRDPPGEKIRDPGPQLRGAEHGGGPGRPAGGPPAGRHAGGPPPDQKQPPAGGQHSEHAEPQVRRPVHQTNFAGKCGQSLVNCHDS